MSLGETRVESRFLISFSMISRLGFSINPIRIGSSNDMPLVVTLILPSSIEAIEILSASTYEITPLGVWNEKIVSFSPSA